MLSANRPTVQMLLDSLKLEYDRAWDRFNYHQRARTMISRLVATASGILVVSLIVKPANYDFLVKSAQPWIVLSLGFMFAFLLSVSIYNEIKVMACTATIDAIEKSINAVFKDAPVLGLFSVYVRKTTDWRVDRTTLAWRLPEMLWWIFGLFGMIYWLYYIAIIAQFADTAVREIAIKTVSCIFVLVTVAANLLVFLTACRRIEREFRSLEIKRVKAIRDVATELMSVGPTNDV